MPKMGYGAMHGRVTRYLHANDPMYAPRREFSIASIFDQVFPFPHRLLFGNNSFVELTVHPNISVSHHLYTIVKHLSCMFDQRRHRSNASTRASHWLSGKSFDWCLQLALAASPNRTSPSAYNNTFFRPLHSRGVALVEQSSVRPGMARHALHSAGGGFYARFSCRFICAAAANLPCGLHPQLARSSCLREHATGGL
jgi:hypothetical protein